MTVNANTLVFNTTAAKYCNLALEIDIAQSVGFSGLETTASKIKSYLDADHTVGDLKKALNGLPVFGVGTVLDLERHGKQLTELMAEAEAIFEIAHQVGARGVQLITGPLDYREVVRYQNGEIGTGYRGVLEYPIGDQIDITASCLRSLARSAAGFGLLVYLEALAWTPLNKIAHQLALLEKASCDNLKMVVDFWHCYASGDSPEEVAKLDCDLIYGVHVCDSLQFDGGVPNEVVLRDVPTGEGILNLREWVDAVKATGYSGWWCSETFCRRVQQENSYKVASEMKAQLVQLLSE